MSDATANKNVLFFGPQGVGKGTQAAVVAPLLGLAHVSTGDLFRQQYRGEDGTRPARSVRSSLQANLMPDDVTIAMLDDHLIHLRETHPELRGVIFDGFPRTVAQVESLDAFLGSRG